MSGYERGTHPALNVRREILRVTTVGAYEVGGPGYARITFGDDAWTLNKDGTLTRSTGLMALTYSLEPLEGKIS